MTKNTPSTLSIRRWRIGSIIWSKFMSDAKWTWRIIELCFKRLKNWILSDLKPIDVERQFSTSKQLLQRQKEKNFLHRILIGNEKLVHYDNPKSRKSNIHDSPLYLMRSAASMEWKFTGARYQTQLMRLSRALKEKWPHSSTWQVSTTFCSWSQSILWNAEMECFSTPAISSTDIVPWDYYLSRPMKRDPILRR